MVQGLEEAGKGIPARIRTSFLSFGSPSYDPNLSPSRVQYPPNKGHYQGERRNTKLSEPSTCIFPTNRQVVGSTPTLGSTYLP